MYVCVTHVDAQTGTPCTEAPMATGPTFPALKGLEVLWWNQSQWPTNTPLFYGTCADDADISISGVISILTEEQYLTLRQAESASFAGPVRYERNQRIFAAQIYVERALRQARMGLPTTDDLTKWDEYIQALAEVPEQAGFPFDVTWPVSPYPLPMFAD